MKKSYIIDCAGNKVPMGDELFFAKCWVGNSNDYLEANKQFIIAESKDWIDIPKISILIPIYRSGERFLETLNSILSQEWPQPQNVEIILYINQPLGPIEEFTKTSIKVAKEFIKENNSKENTPNVRLVFEQLAGGLAEVYQRNFTTLIARIKNNVSARNLETKQENVDALKALMESTVFAIVDDDQILLDTRSLPMALNKLQAGKSTVMGQVEITEVSTSHPNWDAILLDIMNLFLRFKYEHGNAILTPRALIVSDLFHMPALKIGEEYADQIWFAAASAGKQRFMINVTTTLEHEEYPSNANMVEQLGEFLEYGTLSNAVDIFRNVQALYEKSTENLVYSIDDVNQVISALESRDKNKIGRVAKRLISSTTKNTF